MNPVDQSKAEAELARARLDATFSNIRERTKPEALLVDVKTAARKRATKVAIVALSNAKIRPFAAAGIAATAIAYLFRNPIVNALKKSLGEGEKHDR